MVLWIQTSAYLNKIWTRCYFLYGVLFSTVQISISNAFLSTCDICTTAMTFRWIKQRVVWRKCKAQIEEKVLYEIFILIVRWNVRNVLPYAYPSRQHVYLRNKYAHSLKFKMFILPSFGVLKFREIYKIQCMVSKTDENCCLICV